MLSSSDVRALRRMLGDLTSHRLEVILTPSKRQEYATRGGMIRVVLDTNAAWYQRMCADHPSSRKRKNRAPDTRIKRQYTIQVLEKMIRTRLAVTPYQTKITNYIPGALHDVKMQDAEERRLAKRQKPQQSAFTHSPHDDDSIPF